ncbi:diguanylate cyclase domain-containing protein [Pseudanabaena minima]|uniref:diguanylate cyclase domain-containing protein n=1 Tax=Pseudanabaena minima TaxID=890415 RepID=UPI003DA98AB1
MSSLKKLCDRPLIHRLSLQAVLIVPFVLQIFVAVGMVGYLSFRNGQESINRLANQLVGEVNDRVHQHLDSYLAVPHQINQINADAARSRILNLKDLETTGRYLWQQMQVYKTLSYIFYALPSGEYSGAGRWVDGGMTTIDEVSPRTNFQDYSYETDAQGHRKKLIFKGIYKPLTEDWYLNAVRTGKPMWSRIYNWDNSPEFISISASLPFYDDRQKLIGVFGSDFLLSSISKFLKNLKSSQKGTIFIVERDGNLVASSSEESPFVLVGKTARRLSASQSTAPLIRGAITDLQRKIGQLQFIKVERYFDVQLGSDRYYALVRPWQDQYGLNWLVIVIIPESDFMEQINANTRTSLLLCLASLAIATILGIYTSRWIAYPILKLQQASEVITNGELDHSVEVKGIYEIERLARSFNQMTVQLKSSFGELEDRVAERTTSLQQANLRLLELANSDGLTKIPNRRYFDNCLAKEWQRHLREQKFLGLVMLDIDYFKYYNDYYGHQGGDEVLLRVAQIINQVPRRASDLVARYGGEEFAVILPNTSVEGAFKFAEQIRESVLSLEIPHARSQVSKYVTLSLGAAAMMPNPDNKLEDLITQADEALYQAKKLGRNQSFA